MSVYTNGATLGGGDLAELTQIPNHPKPETEEPASIQPSKVGGACRPNPFLHHRTFLCLWFIIYSFFHRAQRRAGSVAGSGIRQRTQRGRPAMLPRLPPHFRYDLIGVAVSEGNKGVRAGKRWCKQVQMSTKASTSVSCVTWSKVAVHAVVIFTKWLEELLNMY